MSKKMRTALVVIGIMLILYSLVCILGFRHNLGSYITGVAGIIMVIIGVWHEQILAKTQKGWKKGLRIGISTVMIAILLSFGAVVVAIGVNAMNTPKTEADAVIVLGAGLVEGEWVSAHLAMRLDKAVEYLTENQRTVVVVSGGQGPDERISEALAMKNYLLQRGISEERILLEDQSTSTYENFMYSKVILDEFFIERPDYEIVHITNNFHALRAGVYAKRVGFVAESLSSNSPMVTMLGDFSREYMALLICGAEYVVSAVAN